MTYDSMSPDDLYRLTLVGDARISPDGSRVAYVVRRLDREANDYVGNIYLWESGESRQLTAGGKDSAPRWSPDGEHLAFLSGREEKAQIYLLPMAGGEPIRLTEQKLGAGAPI
jgi:dipeptidyl aminopeptidase/acylaminoacyl peptidase